MKCYKNPVIALLYLVMLILKLDGKAENVSWFLIFAPMLIELSAEVFVKIISSVVSLIHSVTERTNVNQQFYAGQKCYWDASNNRMYVPFEVEDNVND